MATDKTTRATTRSVRQAFPGAGAVAVGAICGLAWAASLRGWMAQIAGGDSSFSWLGTFVLLLVPGVVVGALLGWAQHLRNVGALRGRRQGWLVFSPVLFAAALVNPATFHALITTGQGGGALAVVIIGLTGGYALSRRGPLWATIVTGLLAATLIVGCASVPAVDVSRASAHGVWVAVQAASLLGVLCIACSIPHRSSPAQD